MQPLENYRALGEDLLKAYRSRRSQALKALGAEVNNYPRDNQRVKYNQSEKTILIYGFIDDWSLDEVAWQLRDVPEDEPLTVRINSDGGDYFAGTGIASLLMSRTGKVTTAIDGKAFSAAAIIFLAGDVRKMAKNVSKIMFHRAWTVYLGIGSGNADAIAALDFSDEIANEADWLNGIDEDIKGLIAERSNLSEKEAASRIEGEKEWKMSAAQAVDVGIATEYEDVGYEDADAENRGDHEKEKDSATIAAAAVQKDRREAPKPQACDTIVQEPDRASLYAGMFGG